MQNKNKNCILGEQTPCLEGSFWCSFSYCYVTESWRMTMSAFQCVTPHYAGFKLAVLSVTGLAAFLKRRIRQCITVWNTEQCFVIIYTNWVSVLNCSSCRLNTAPLFRCSSGPPCSNMCDLYMMNHVGPQFWHVVLSWESLAKRLNSPHCKNAWQSSGGFWKATIHFQDI